MGIQFAVHTYGHHDAMFLVLNGIKMIMNHGFTDALIKLMALLATSYYALLGMAGAYTVGAGKYFLKTCGMVLVITALLLPKADMLVVDRVTKKQDIVQGLPYAFVIPVGILEAFGAGITSIFEQAFSKVGSAPFKDYGMIFGHRIVQESKDWKIANPEFVRNMDAFLARCVVLEAMIGTKFTPADVYSSGNILDLVTENAGTFRKVDFRSKNRSHKFTCKEAAAHLKTYFGLEISHLNTKYSNSDFNKAGVNTFTLNLANDNGQLNKLLARNLEIGYGSSLGVQNKAEDIIRQNMMINAVKDFNNKSDLYGYTRASSIQNSNWSISAELAKEYLPMLLNIMKALVYASFIFIVPLMIMQGGMVKYLKYCTVVFSLQIWPALNSILNLFIELYSQSRGVGITGGSITYSNFNQAHQAIDTIVLVASSLQMSIPFLSFAIVQGGVQSFVHLAGSVQAASAGAASIASGEITSGSRSFDNISKGNQTIDQKSGFKTDWNQSHQERATQVQGASGAMYRTFADGSSAINSGVGLELSSGSRRFSLSNGMQVSAQTGLSNALTAARSADQNYTDSMTASERSVVNLISQLAKSESLDDSADYKQLGEQGKVLQQLVNSTRSRHDKGSDGYEQDARAAVNMYIDAGGKIPDFIPIVKGSAGIRTSGEISAAQKSNQSLDFEEGVTNNNDVSKSMSNQDTVAKNKQWMERYNIDSSLAEEAQGSYEKAQSYQKIVNQKTEEADSYRQALEYSKNTGATDDRDMYHEVEHGIMKQYKVSQNEAHKMIEGNDPRANKVWDNIVDKDMNQLLAQVKNGKAKVENIANNDATAFENQHSTGVNDHAINDVKQRASNDGLDKSKVQNNIDSRKSNIEKLHKKITDENKVQYNSVLHANKLLNNGLEQKVLENEKARLSKKLNIGGDTLEQKSLKSMQDRIKPLKPK